MVRKDPQSGLPRDGDIIICQNMLAEIRKRANLVIENTKKAEKYTGDISEYLKTLATRGISFPDPGLSENSQAEKSTEKKGPAR